MRSAQGPVGRSSAADEGTNSIRQFNDRAVSDHRVVCVVTTIRDGVDRVGLPTCGFVVPPVGFEPTLERF